VFRHFPYLVSCFIGDSDTLSTDGPQSLEHCQFYRVPWENDDNLQTHTIASRHKKDADGLVSMPNLKTLHVDQFDRKLVSSIRAHALTSVQIGDSRMTAYSNSSLDLSALFWCAPNIKDLAVFLTNLRFDADTPHVPLRSLVWQYHRPHQIEAAYDRGHHALKIVLAHVRAGSLRSLEFGYSRIDPHHLLEIASQPALASLQHLGFRPHNMQNSEVIVLIASLNQRLPCLRVVYIHDYGDNIPSLRTTLADIQSPHFCPKLVVRPR